MDGVQQPTKQQVRDWLNRRKNCREPLPDIEFIRRDLGWCFCGQQPTINNFLIKKTGS